MAKEYFSMNNVPIGTKLKIKEDSTIVELIEILHYPTLFKTKDDNGNIKIFQTNEIEIIDENSSSLNE